MKLVAMVSKEHLKDKFSSLFGTLPHLVVRSPGRVNLIGEHTDYNDGWVLPAALDMGTCVAAGPRADGRLRTFAARLGEADEIALADIRPQEGPEWARYCRGVAALLRQAGCALPGANLLIDGDLPLSGGLSSSASLELGVAVALAELAECTWERRALALLAQRAEHEFAGVQCGIMDQFAVAFGQAGHALLIDCRSLAVEAVPVPESVHILVLDSAVRRTLAGSAYNQRRAECAEAVRCLQTTHTEVRALRDVTPEMLMEAVLRGCPAEDRPGPHGGLPLRSVVLHRARHVVSENQRVLDTVAALRRGDVAACGRLMVASHQSLRDDYEVSCPELDTLVEIALVTPGVLGARLTGAGFGGAAVALVQAGQAQAAAATIVARYREASGRDGQAYVCKLAEGVRVLKDASEQPSAVG